MDYKDFISQCVPAKMECEDKKEYKYYDKDDCKCKEKKEYECEEKKEYKCKCVCQEEKKEEKKYYFCEEVKLKSKCGDVKKVTIKGEVQFCE